MKNHIHKLVFNVRFACYDRGFGGVWSVGLEQVSRDRPKDG